MKQTAVQWLIDELIRVGYFENTKPNITFKQAKELEKQQIIEANNVGVNQGLYGYRNAKEYYNKTYKIK